IESINVPTPMRLVALSISPKTAADIAPRISASSSSIRVLATTRPSLPTSRLPITPSTRIKSSTICRIASTFPLRPGGFPTILVDRFGEPALLSIDITQRTMQSSQDLAVISVEDEILKIIRDLVEQDALLDQVAILLQSEVGHTELPTCARNRETQRIVLRV